MPDSGTNNHPEVGGGICSESTWKCTQTNREANVHQNSAEAGKGLWSTCAREAFTYLNTNNRLKLSHDSYFKNNSVFPGVWNWFQLSVRWTKILLPSMGWNQHKRNVIKVVLWQTISNAGPVNFLQKKKIQSGSFPHSNDFPQTISGFN